LVDKEQVKCSNSTGIDHLATNCLKYDIYTKACVTIVGFFQKSGARGFKGGDAGKGGAGGFVGFDGRYIHICKTEKLNYIPKFKTDGQGIHGKPGKEGLGGNYGDSANKGYVDTYNGVAENVMTLGLMSLTLFANGYYDEYDSFKPNFDRGESGKIDKTLNSKNQQNATTKELI
jgi:hypothetical protein